jgi:hypothetical protein
LQIDIGIMSTTIDLRPEAKAPVNGNLYTLTVPKALGGKPIRATVIDVSECSRALLVHFPEATKGPTARFGGQEYANIAAAGSTPVFEFAAGTTISVQMLTAFHESRTAQWFNADWCSVKCHLSYAFNPHASADCQCGSQRKIVLTLENCQKSEPT